MAYESNLNKGAYGSPQRIVDTKTRDLLKENTIQNNLLKTFSSVGELIAKQKKFTEQSTKAQDKQEIALYNALNTAGSTGFAHLDESVLRLWNDKVDDFFTIKNAMHHGDISRREGNRELAKIMAMPKQWAEIVKVLAENKKGYDEAVKNGTISSLGSIENKSILEGNKWEISEQGGNFFFYQDAFSMDGVDYPKAVVNGNALLAANAAGKDMYEEKVNISEMLTSAFNNLTTPDDVQSQYYTVLAARNGDKIPGNKKGEVFTNIPEGQEYTYKMMTKEQNDKTRVDLLPVLQPILNNQEIMPSYWQDEIPDGEEGAEDNDQNSLTTFYNEHEQEFAEKNITRDQWVNSAWNYFGKDLDQETQDFLKQKQMQAATNFMVEQAMQENNTVDQTLKVMSKRNIQPEENPSTYVGPDFIKVKDVASLVQDVVHHPNENKNSLKGKLLNGTIIDEVELDPQTGKIKLYSDKYKLTPSVYDEEHEKNNEIPKGYSVGDEIPNEFDKDIVKNLLYEFDPLNPEDGITLTELISRSYTGSSETARKALNNTRNIYLNLDRRYNLEKQREQERVNKELKLKGEMKDRAIKYKSQRNGMKNMAMTPAGFKAWTKALSKNAEYLRLKKEILELNSSIKEAEGIPEFYDLKDIEYSLWKSIATGEAAQNAVNNLQK